MTITAVNTDGKGWTMLLGVCNHYLFDDGVIQATKIGIVIPPDATVSLLKNMMKIVDTLE